MELKDIETILPLSPAQEDAVYRSTHVKETSVASGQLSCELRGRLDLAAFTRAWEHAVQSHQLLRALLVSRHVTQPLLVVRREVKPKIVQEDWCEISAAEQEERWASFLEDERTHAFDMAVAPLMRLWLFRLGAEHWRLVCSYHQLILDAESVTVLWREVLAAYDHFTCGAGSSLSPAKRYEEYVAWLKQQDQSAAEAFFREMPADAAAESNADKAVPEQQQAWLDVGPTAALHALEAHDISLATMIEGAWAILLSRYSDESSVCVGVDISARPDGETVAADPVGAFRHPLPLRVNTTGAKTLFSLFRSLEKQKAELRRYNYCSLAHLYESNIIPAESRFFETQVKAWEDEKFATTDSLEVSRLLRRETPACPLSLAVQNDSGKLLLTIDYDANRYAAATVSGMLDHLRTLLTAIGSQPEQSPASVSILGEAELQKLLIEWNSTTTAYPRDRTMPELFAEQVECAPDAIAVISDSKRLTYLELDERANKLAHHLQSLGVGPDVPVGFFLDRSLEMIVSMLAILKAGGAYVPFETGYPAKRLTLMLEDSGVPVLVTKKSLLDRLPAHTAQVVCVDADNDLISAQSSVEVNSNVGPDNLAYIIYTSGSTGVPKGVCVSHRSVVRLVKDTNFFVYDRSQIFLQTCAISFDVSIFEIWGSLLNGARLVLLPPHTPTLEEIGEIIRDRGVTTAWLTAGLFHLMVDERLEDLSKLRHLLAGGDVLSVSHVRRAMAALEDGQFINGYGPTENTTFTSCCLVSNLPAETTSVPIGRPISNTQIYLLDRELRPVPIGVTGELYSGGDGVARGYHKRPDLTAERFVPDPFSTVPGARLYKTGDLARYLPDGEIEFLGRHDFQVKVRGFRIELEEVEAVLSTHPRLRQCFVTVSGAGADKQLVAYAVLDEAGTLTAAGMRSFLREKLPEYMVPTQFMTLDAFPLSPNGKIDRRALPAFAVKPPENYEDYTAPRTPVEELLVGIWSEVLDVRLVGIRDDFFDLGGHSLRATQIVSRVRETFQKALPIRLLFDTPTIEALAAFLESERQISAAATPPLERIDRHQPLPLSFAQQRLWFLNQLEPDSAAYNIPVALRVTGNLDVAALEHAFDDLIKRHEPLRTTFVTDNGRPQQLISPPGKFDLPVTDLSGWSPSEREEQAQRLTAQEAQRPFDLTNGPLLRPLLLKLSEQDYVILLIMHHIVSDAWSMGLLTRELTTLYEAHAGGWPVRLPELSIQYIDFAHWQRQWLTGEVLAEQLAYWRKQLGGELPTLRLPAVAPSEPARGGSHTFAFSRAQTETLKSLSRSEGATFFMTLLTAFEVVLSCYTGQTDIVVGAPVAGRTRPEVEPLIGFFVNTLALRTNLSGDPTFSELLGRVREVTLDAYAHQDVPFDKLVEDLRPDRTAADSPLFQAAFTLDNTRRETIELPGLKFTPWPVGFEATRYSLIMQLVDTDEQLVGSFQYDARLFGAESIARLAEHYGLLLDHIASQPETRLSEFASMFADADRRREEARREEFRTARRKRLREAKAAAQS